TARSSEEKKSKRPGPFVRKSRPRPVHGTVNPSLGQRRCCQKIRQKINAIAKNEALRASVSIVRPLLISSSVVSQATAAIVDPTAPKLRRPNVARTSATIRTEIADGKRAIHSLRIPETRKDAARSQLINGGLFK